MNTKFWSENVKGRNQPEDLGVEKKIVLEWILRKCGGEGVDWVHVVQNMLL
jgi:hypothetical protein